MSDPRDAANRRNAAPRARLVFILLLMAIAVAGVVFFLILRSRSTANFPAASALPVDHPFMGCAPEGDGGDPVLNIRKNRDDEPAPGGAGYRDQSFESFIATPWPRTVDRRLTRNRSHSESAEIAAYEGAPVAVTGYITGLKQEGPESPNCRGGVNVQRDMHLWLTLAPDPDRSNAIVAEVTPRLRSRYPGWNPTAFRRLVKRRMLVRISGWMMLDPEHPDQLGKTRGTLWEIHPVMKIEVRTDSGWAIFE